MTAFGVTPQGFVPMTFSDLKTAMESAAQATIAATIDLSPSEPMGQIIGIAAEPAATAWQALEDAYHAAIPDDATGASLVSLAGITGTLQEPPRRSTGVETLIGTAGTVVPAGRVVSVLGASASKFRTTADATLAAPPAWSTSANKLPGDRVGISGRLYQYTQAGTTSSSAGPSATSGDIIDGSAHCVYLGAGTGVADQAVEGVAFGAVAGFSGTVTVIETPVAGLASVLNLADFALGNLQESDASLRQRREQGLRASGNASLAAIQAKLSGILTADGAPGVTSATVFENTSMATNGDGMPPKSIEALVLQPTGVDVDAQVFATLFASVAAGIEIHGQVVGTVIDSQGVAHTVKFTRPTGRRIYVGVDLTKDPLLYPIDGDAQVRNAIVDYALSSYQVGANVVPSALLAQVFRIAGVRNVTSLRVGFTSPPVATSEQVIAARELATIDSADVQVTSSDYSP